METQVNVPTFWTTGWLPNGAKISFTVPIATDAYTEALAFTNALLAKGFLLNAPGLEPGEESAIIETVMRRQKDDGTPIIDFYPQWGAGGDEPFGTYKWLHKYLNDADEIEAFCKVAGFRSLEDIPLYDGQAPLVRKAGKPHPKETRVRASFKVVKRQGEEKTGSDGKVYRPWLFVRYESDNVIPLNPPTDAPAKVAGMSDGEAAAALLNGNGQKTERSVTAPPKPWSADDPLALGKLINRAEMESGHSHTEVVNTVGKMHTEGKFAGKAAHEALALVLERLASHEQKAKPKSAPEPESDPFAF